MPKKNRNPNLKNRNLSKLQNFKFFSKVSIFDSFFFNLKRELNCHYFAKKIIEIGQMVLEISYFEEKKSSEIGLRKLIFYPRAHKLALIFVFMCYFCSVIEHYFIFSVTFKLHFRVSWFSKKHDEWFCFT